MVAYPECPLPPLQTCLTFLTRGQSIGLTVSWIHLHPSWLPHPTSQLSWLGCSCYRVYLVNGSHDVVGCDYCTCNESWAEWSLCRDRVTQYARSTDLRPRVCQCFSDPHWMCTWFG